MTRDNVTLANLLPAGCPSAEAYVTAIITEARTREGRALDGFTFDPTEATICMMMATKAVNDAWDEVPIDNPTANDEDAYVLALDRAFRSIVANRDRIRTAIEQPADEEPSNHEPLTVNPEPSTTIDEQPAIEVPAPDAQPASPSQPSMPAPYQPSDLDDPDCTIMIDGQTYRDADGDYHHVNSDETLYVSIPQTFEGITSAELAGDDHEVLRVAMKQHRCQPIDTPNALLRILKDYGLVTTLHEVTDDEPTEEPSNHEPLTVNPEPSTTIDEQPTIEQPTATEEQSTAPSVERPSMDASPAPVLTAPAPAPSNDTKATPAEVQAVLATMPDLATSTAVAIRKAAPNFRLMFSIDAVANARTIEWSMPDPTHVTLTATEEDGTIWSQREDVKNGGRRVTVTEADGTCTQFKSVGKLIAYLNGQCALEDAIKSSKKVTPSKPTAPSPQDAVVPVGHVQEKEPQPAAIEQPTASEPAPVEEQPDPIDEPTIDEQPTVSEGQPSMAATEPQPSQPAAPVETTASTPEKAAYVWDPVAARDIIVAKRDEGVITLTPNADGTAYTVTGDTKKVRGYLKGLNAKWDPETTNWTLPALALTDPTKASEERNAIVADRNAIREAKRAARAEAAPAKPEPKKTASKADAAAKQPALKGAKTTYDITEVQNLIAAAVKTALSMVAATANNEKAITAIVAKILNDPRNAVGLTA